ncbi:hypothetical protein TNIN_457051 [Trichonephila inaurata madagascariensis]|uniref:Uncharacterized protein n=1 Tax=Trichonephila inaurata madagascariensis TaxID=2747483 RepID=A0A8X7CD09_9ARAC|nr:hypothetical protein TNIN_457051 [Trichonephila inaurata madagascariensis]
MRQCSIRPNAGAASGSADWKSPCGIAPGLLFRKVPASKYGKDLPWHSQGLFPTLFPPGNTGLMLGVFLANWDSWPLLAASSD